jgi:hypothetical protein
MGILIVSVLTFLSATAQAFETCTVMLVDSSASVASDSLRKRFESEIKKVIQGAKPNRVIAVDFIQSSSESESLFPIQMELPAESLMQNRIKFDKQIEQSKQAALKSTETLFTNMLESKQTDIIGALRSAAKIFNADRCIDAEKKELIVFSDMIHETKALNLLKTDPAQFRGRNLQRLVLSIDDPPNLRGVTVWVSGAGASVLKPANSAFFRHLQAFWTAFFRNSGATLTDSRYAANLLNYP